MQKLVYENPFFKFATHIFGNSTEPLTSTKTYTKTCSIKQTHIWNDYFYVLMVSEL